MKTQCLRPLRITFIILCAVFANNDKDIHRIRRTAVIGNVDQTKLFRIRLWCTETLSDYRSQAPMALQYNSFFSDYQLDNDNRNYRELFAE